MRNAIRFCVLPVSEVAGSAAFYRALGCVERGADGDRWAGLASEHVALSLCGPADPKRPSRPAFAVLVDDVEAALAQALAAGGRALPEGEAGGVQLTDPDGNHIMLIQRSHAG
ncbi:VOC family protein [Amycolatopsis sp. NPDC051903]|uniref:VOC family protein n=1 Tax=Amycolatopsis sp. NPDC051903 TaxID=3363936 RepID=UPI00379E8D19